MATYQERLDDRNERLESAIDRARTKGHAALSAARRIADGIPMGQPILVGHHSEKRARADIARIDSNMRAGVDAYKDADRLESIAQSTPGISSDCDDAVDLLREKVAKLEVFQAKMIAGNKLVRKKDRAGIVEMFGEKRADELLTPDFCGRLGFPSYATTNNNANIRRIKERIAQLEGAAAAPVMETIEGDGWTLSEDRDDNRIVIRFDAKPDEAMRSALKHAGFKWSPTRNAHIRMTSNAAIYTAKRALGIA